VFFKATQILGLFLLLRAKKEPARLNETLKRLYTVRLRFCSRYINL